MSSSQHIIRLGDGNAVTPPAALMGQTVVMLKDEEHGDWKTAAMRGLSGAKKGDRVVVLDYFPNMYGFWLSVRMPDGTRIDVRPSSVGYVPPEPVQAPPTFRVTEELSRMLFARAKVGLETYGDTLDRKDVSEADWLQHGIEEALDQAGYMLAAKYRAIETETAVRAAVQLLVLGDNAGALAILDGMYPQAGDEAVTLVRDAGGA